MDTTQIMVGDRLGWPEHLSSREFEVLVTGFQKLFDYDPKGLRLEGVGQWIQLDDDVTASDKVENIGLVVLNATSPHGDKGVLVSELEVLIHHESTVPDWKVTAKFLVNEERFDVMTRVPA